MKDVRVEQYAKLLVDRCVDVQPGWQVVVQTSPLARPLLEEVVRAIAKRGAYPLVRLTYQNVSGIWANEAPEDLLRELPPIAKFEAANADAFILISAPENTRDGSEIATDRLGILRPAMFEASKRRLSLEVPWVGCQFPTAALAQDAGMVLSDFEDFLFGACLLDWDEEGRKMQRLCDYFDKTSEVRIVGEGTDLKINIEGRKGMVDDGHLNMPGGEFFYSPVEEATTGVVTFAEFPAVYIGNEVIGARFVYEKGKIVEATADQGEEYLIKTIDSDAGSRTLGELGIGCNPGITKHMKNTLFDEKIYGTIHLAVGAGFPFIGGKNVSTVHWDMVKDLRKGGQIFCDGTLVQENGEWVI